MTGCTGKIVSGAEFKRLIAETNWTLVKYLESDDFSQPQPEHYNFHYRFGLNQIPEDNVCLDPKNECSAGGLYFTYIESREWVRRHWFAVTVPDDARVLFENMKFKTDKLLILNEINPTEDMYLKVVRRNAENIKYVPFPTEEMCLTAVRQHGQTLRYIKNQTEAICLAAVQQSGCALSYVKKQTEAICLAAVQQNRRAIQYVESPTKEMWQVAKDTAPTLSCLWETCYLCVLSTASSFFNLKK
jgi:hypothetical protein